jgi:hypothetical protein
MTLLGASRDALIFEQGARCGEISFLCCAVADARKANPTATNAELADAALDMLEAWSRLARDERFAIIFTVCVSTCGVGGSTPPGGGTQPPFPGGQAPQPGQPPPPGGAPPSDARVECGRELQRLCDAKGPGGVSLLDALEVFIVTSSVIPIIGEIGDRVIADISVLRRACASGAFSDINSLGFNPGFQAACRLRAGVQAILVSVGPFNPILAAIGAIFATKTLFNCCTLGSPTQPGPNSGEPPPPAAPPPGLPPPQQQPPPPGPGVAVGEPTPGTTPGVDAPIPSGDQTPLGDPGGGGPDSPSNGIPPELTGVGEIPGVTQPAALIRAARRPPSPIGSPRPSAMSAMTERPLLPFRPMPGLQDAL